VAPATAGRRTAPTPTRLKTSQTYYHRNQQYSIVGLTNAAGTLVERYTYSAYGTLGIYAANGTVRSSSTYANRYTYTGREWDGELRLYHFRARWYDPATGGFVSRDPLGYVDGMSLYRGYFGLQAVDPEGTKREVCCSYSNGTSLWSWTLEAEPSQTAKDRCSERANWGYGKAWSIIHAREGNCREPARDMFFVKFTDDWGRNFCEECVAGCGLGHTDLHSLQKGELLVGIHGPGNGVKSAFGDSDLVLEISRSELWTLKYGFAEGKTCATATDAEIVDCILKAPLPMTTDITPNGPMPKVVKGKGGAFNNCQTHVADSAFHCCLGLGDFAPVAVPGREMLDPAKQIKGAITFINTCGPSFPFPILR